MKRNRFLTVSFVGCLALACGGAPSDGASATPHITEAEAREIATRLGTEEGYDPAVYTEVSARWDEGESAWWVHVEHAPPAPPGGHYAVAVDGATGEARLVHGE